jgi:hypothetical protein
MRGTATKPFARIGKARIYRTRIVFASHVRYLNLGALKKARKTLLEIGSVTAGAVTVSVVAEIKYGLITTLRLAHCEKCDPRRSVRARAQHDRKKLLRDVFSKLGVAGATKLPIPVARLAAARSSFVIDVVITPDGVLCVRIEANGSGCLICEDGTTCYRPNS